MKTLYSTIRTLLVIGVSCGLGCSHMQPGVAQLDPVSISIDESQNTQVASTDQTKPVAKATTTVQYRGQSPSGLNGSYTTAPGNSQLPRYGMPVSGQAINANAPQNSSLAAGQGTNAGQVGSYSPQSGYSANTNQQPAGYPLNTNQPLGSNGAGSFVGAKGNQGATGNNPTGAGIGNGAASFQPPPLNGINGGAITGGTVGNGLQNNAIQNTGAPQGSFGPQPGVAPIVPNQGVSGGAEAVGSFMDSGPNQYNQIPFNVYLNEARTGRFMFGMGVNSDAGVTGQIIVDERNFDITKIPLSVDDWLNNAFRGGGQGLRIEAIPGSQVQRYLINFTEPYFLYTPFSLNVSGFFYDRIFDDWIEQRLGGRVGLGYRINHDLSVGTSVRMEKVNLRDPRVRGVPELESSLGDSDLYSGQVRLTHDTRDTPFAPTQGHYFEMKYEQAFGTFDFPRGEIDYRRYFLLHERADYSGRHTLAVSGRFGVSGSDTPIFENFFAGGFTTLRGFDFRGASPTVNTVKVGGEMLFLGSVEYMFPLTADDMLKGVLFVDYGTVEETTSLDWDDFRVAPGFGVRISVPALGPAPLAFDFAFPVAQEDTDDERIFSFFFGFGRM